MTKEEEQEGDPSREPSPDRIGAARHAGFADAISDMPADRRERLMSDYLKQDRRRELNVGKFIEVQ